MDISLQKTLIAPVKAAYFEQQGAMTPSKSPQTPLQKPTATIIPAELGAVAAVNEARLSGQKPVLSDVKEPERVLKPYGVTMLPRNETREKVTEHKA